MSLGFLFGGGVGSEPHGLELFDAYPTMRELYRRISGWTGLTVDQILHEPLPPQREHRQSAGTIRETALALGVHDVIAEHGLRASVLGGLSLGAMTASCLAGAVDRESLFRMLAHAKHAPEPEPGEPEQGLALAFVPNDGDAALYRGEGRPGIFPAGDFGPTVDGTAHIIMLAGEREALAQLAAEVTPGTLIPLPDRSIAVHTPLRRPFRDFMAPYIDGMRIAPPEVPLLSCLEQRVLTTADDVRDLFHRNPTDPISLVDLYRGMREQGVRLALVVGGSIPEGILRFPFQVVNVDRPEHIAQVMTSVYELGIDITVGEARR